MIRSRIRRAGFLAATGLFLVATTRPGTAAEMASVALPWGDAVASAIQGLGSVLVPLAMTAAMAAVARLTGPLRLLITASLVERLVRNVADYAVNAVAGATRGQTLTVPVGSLVIARAVQRGLDAAPGWLIRAAGGGAGLGEKVFRSLPLTEEATVANTLVPALRAAEVESRRRTP